MEIYDIIFRYINNKNSNYSLLINGEWGSGKTYCINNVVIKTLKKEKELSNYKILYLSLYGVKSIDDISKNIFYQSIKLNPDSKLFKISKLAFSIFLPTNINIDENIYSEFCNIDENYILFVDDLERINLPIDLVLGHFNNYLEHDKIKIIFICNESEIKNFKKYKKIKEKIVGITYKLEPDINEIIISIIDEYKSNTFGFFENLNNSKDNIIDIYNKSNTNNIRLLKNAINNYLFIYEYAIEKFKPFMKSLFSETLIYTLALFFELHSGKTEIKNLEKINNYNELLSNLFSEQSEDKEILNLYSKYQLNHFCNSHNFISIYNYIKNGNFNKNQFDNEVNLFYNLKNLSSIEKIRNWWELSDKDFLDSIIDINEQLNQGAIQLNKVPLLFWYYKAFSDFNLINKSIDELSILFENNINKNVEKSNFCYELDFDFEMFNRGIEKDEKYINIKNLVVNANEILLNKEIKSYYAESLKTIKDDISQIDLLLYNNKYSKHPFLANIDIDELFSLITNSDNKTIIKFRNFIDNLYEKNSDFKDKDFKQLSDFKAKLDQYIQHISVNSIQKHNLVVLCNSLNEILNLSQ
jgi:hypothetical protein